MSSSHVVVVGGTDVGSAERLLRALPAQLEMAIVVCVPIGLPTLEAASRLPVETVGDRVRLMPGRVYVVPPERQVRFTDGELIAANALSPPSLDIALRSLADAAGRTAIAVILAGRGSAGALGVQRVKEAGGWTIAQDIGGDLAEMPRSAAATGIVDLVLPVEQIASRLVDSIALTDDAELGDDDVYRADVADTLREILTFVRVRTGRDFTAYKRATMYRRMSRRMQVCECRTMAEYHRYLRDHPAELPNLLRDFLISVTQFFRDPPTFEIVEQTVVPRMFADKSGTDQVRAWIAGCATGEEAYTIAMLLLEHAAKARVAPQIQVFATDIDERALSIARLGCYPESIASDVSEERLTRFFTRENGQYRVSKELRALVLFSPHDVLRDPPFSRLDFVSCRNLLIYLDREAQNRVLTTFHFGLRPDGLLLLGSSESADGSTSFAPLDPKYRVFVRRPTMASASHAVAVTGRWHPPPITAPRVPAERPPSAGEVHHRLVESYAPPSALVNGDLDVVHVSEHAGRYFQVAGGEPTRQLLRLVVPELRFDVRSAVYAARQHGSDTRRARFELAGAAHDVEIRTRTIEVPELGRGAVLMMFAEITSESSPATPEPIDNSAIEPVVREIEDELHRTRDQLRTSVEQYETSLEELKASNEELQAINEELRSATEELETSKEELQSVNEELTTVNHELKVKVDELSQANSDLQNLMRSTDIGVVFLDRQLQIKRFTPRVQDIFNVLPSDIGRPIGHLTHRLECDDLVEVARGVLQSLRSSEREVKSRDGRSYLARWLPYRSIEDRIEGVVMTFVDVADLRDAIAARRRSEAALQQVEERLHMAIQSAPIAVLGFEAGRLTWGFALGRELTAGERDDLAMFAPGHGGKLAAIARQVMTNRAGERAELDLYIGAAVRTFDFRIEPTASGATAVGFDITPSKLAEQSLRDADRRKDEFLATLSHELRNPLAPLQVALDVARLIDGTDTQQREQSLSIMERQVAMLTGLVDELLDLSRVTQGKIVLTRTPVDVARVLEAALVATRPAIDAARHVVEVDVPAAPLEVDADFSRLVQVFTNIFANAAKYTPEGGRIGIAVSETGGGGDVVIRVEDNGVGIAPEMLPRIFDIFVQSRDARGRSQGGLGIGLNLVRRLVELHGGTVTATSDGHANGSTFEVTLPRGRKIE